MDKLKIILALVAGFLLALGVLATIGLLQSLLFFGVICIGIVIALRFLMKSGPEQIDTPDPHRELRKAERTVEEYKRKQLLK